MARLSFTQYINLVSKLFFVKMSSISGKLTDITLYISIFAPKVDN